MKKVIWKYESGLHIFHTLQMPKDAEILSVSVQDSNLCVWALVNPIAPLEERHFEVYGTDHTIEEDCGKDRMYLGVTIMNGGDSAFHIFEVWDINNS